MVNKEGCGDTVRRYSIARRQSYVCRGCWIVRLLLVLLLPVQCATERVGVV